MPRRDSPGEVACASSQGAPSSQRRGTVGSAAAALPECAASHAACEARTPAASPTHSICTVLVGARPPGCAAPGMSADVDQPLAAVRIAILGQLSRSQMLANSLGHRRPTRPRGLGRCEPLRTRRRVSWHAASQRLLLAPPEVQVAGAHRSDRLTPASAMKTPPPSERHRARATLSPASTAAQVADAVDDARETARCPACRRNRRRSAPPRYE